MLVNIGQTYAEAVKSIPIGPNGKPMPGELARLKLETKIRFWTAWISILDPLGLHTELHGPTEGILDHWVRRQSEPEIRAGLELMRQRLGVARLSVIRPAILTP